jgi:S13-like H2TH domain
MVPRRHIHDQRRAEVKAQLKQGMASLSQVLEEAQGDDAIGEMRVAALLESLPGIGKVRSLQIMDRAGITESGLVRELNTRQRSALEDEYRLFAEIAEPSSPRKHSYREAHASDDAADDSWYEEDDGYASPSTMPDAEPAYGIEDWDR